MAETTIALRIVRAFDACSFAVANLGRLASDCRCCKSARAELVGLRGAVVTLVHRARRATVVGCIVPVVASFIHIELAVAAIRPATRTARTSTARRTVRRRFICGTPDEIR